MDIFLKAAAGALVTVILCLTLAKQSKDMALLLTITVCSMVIVSAVSCFRPLLDFFDKLQIMGELNSDMMQILLKSVGIGILAEITAMICTDGGNGALAKAIKLLSTAVVLLLAIPLFENMLELIEDILVMV